jgi:6-phosphogluconolactonase
MKVQKAEEVEDYSRTVTICSDLADLTRQAGTQFVSSAEQAVQERGRFTVCLSGGSTPRETYALLADEPLRSRTPWSKVHIFWGDERVVPMDQPDNHHRMASDIFLGKVPIPSENIHRMRVETGEPAQVADDYEALLRSFFDLGEKEMPRFDLVILGMGADGHMASLFPGTSGLREGQRLVVGHYVPKLAADRLTLTLPVLNNARQIMFLVSGVNKDGKVLWMVDKDAASQLQSSTITQSSEVSPQ